MSSWLSCDLDRIYSQVENKDQISYIKLFSNYWPLILSNVFAWTNDNTGDILFNCCVTLVGFTEKKEYEDQISIGMVARGLHVEIPRYNLLDGSNIAQRMSILLSRDLG